MPRGFLHAEWQDLLLVSFQVGPERIAPFLPPGTEPELTDDGAFLSLVGFHLLQDPVSILHADGSPISVGFSREVAL